MENQEKNPSEVNKPQEFTKPQEFNKSFEQTLTLETIRAEFSQFAEERQWTKYHTPRNLLIALTGEVGELSELFQWRGEVQPGLPEFSESEKIKVGEEMSDILAYLIRLADRCQIDLSAAVQRKLQINREKYPAKVCKDDESLDSYWKLKNDYKIKNLDKNS